MLNDLNDGEATAIGVSSCLMEAPGFTAESLGDTVRVCCVVCICINGVPVCMCNRLLYKRVTQPEMCVRQHSSSVFPQLKDELYQMNVLLGITYPKFMEVCKPCGKRIGTILKVPDDQSNMTWAEQMRRANAGGL